MQKKQYLCKRITKKTTALLCFAGGGAVGGKRKCVMFEQRPRKGKTLLFFECKGTAFI